MSTPVDADTIMVRIRDLVPEILADVKYATSDNFTHKVLYRSNELYARRAMALRLADAQRMLQAHGLQLKVFDAYRPLSVQRLMWSLVPDERYVANPAKGSRHNRGAAVDLTLCDATGKELDLGSGYDEFTDRAHMNYNGCTPEQRSNRSLLHDVMKEAGFTVLDTEWWHYDLDGWERFGILNE
ncbi:M15 family metallopeptidase [soil metagenome]